MLDRILRSKPFAIVIVALAIAVVWYAGAIWMNADLQRDAVDAAEQTDYTAADFVAGTLNLDRPKLTSRIRQQPAKGNGNQNTFHSK